MWKYPDGTYKITPPARVELDGYVYPFASLSTEQLTPPDTTRPCR
jgi:hypothetical protein